MHAAALDVHGTVEPDLREVCGGGVGREGAGVVRGVGADVPRVRAGDARPAHGGARLLAGMYPGKLPGKLPEASGAASSGRAHTTLPVSYQICIPKYSACIQIVFDRVGENRCLGENNLKYT